MAPPGGIVLQRLLRSRHRLIELSRTIVGDGEGVEKAGSFGVSRDGLLRPLHRTGWVAASWGQRSCAGQKVAGYGIGGRREAVEEVRADQAVALLVACQHQSAGIFAPQRHIAWGAVEP